MTLAYLRWVNANPRAERICELCLPMIGTVWPADAAPPLPLHPLCYCLWEPTDEEPTIDPDFWDTADEPTRQAWIRYVAWMLRVGIPISLILNPLLEAARRYNEEREEDDEDEEPPMPDENTPTRVTRGHILLSPLYAAPQPGARRELDCVFIQPGRVLRADGSESTWLIPAGVLAAAAPKFNAISSYLDHPEQWGLWGDRQAPRVADLVGVTFDVRWDERLQAIAGGIRLYDQDPTSPGAFVGHLMEQILADQAAGREVPPIGLSAVFYQLTDFDEEAGLRVTREIVHVESVDFVYSPGARGYVRAALAAQRGNPRAYFPAPRDRAGASPRGSAPSQGGTMPEERTPYVADVEDAATPPVVGHEAPPPEPAPQGAPAPTGALEIASLQTQVDELQRAIQLITASLAQQEEAHTVQGMGTPPRSRISVGPAGLEQVEIALEAMLSGVRPPDGIRPLTGIRELYHLLSGDYEMTGIFQPDRVYLANVSSSTMASLVANVLNKRVMTLYATYPRWWEPAVSIEDFATLQDVRWIVLGGVGELPTVAEGAAYTELTWDDKYETASFTKKGGYLGLTIEGIDKDDTRRLRAAPGALAQAAWLTVGKSIAELFTSASGAGPTLVDTGALFNATAVTTAGGHANLGSTALSLTSWRATKLLMMKQAELNSGERLGAITAPKLLWVPLDLEDTAVIILATDRIVGSANNDVNPDAEGNERETRLANARARVIAVPFWTDTNDWAAQADPQLYPSIGLGFRYGRAPEIFSVADPRAGLMFSNDVMPVKVRYLYAVGAIDWRGLYKHNVT